MYESKLNIMARYKEYGDGGEALCILEMSLPL
jgi:hypothetical protein